MNRNLIIAVPMLLIVGSAYGAAANVSVTPWSRAAPPGVPPESCHYISGGGISTIVPPDKILTMTVKVDILAAGLGYQLAPLAGGKGEPPSNQGTAADFQNFFSTALEVPNVSNGTNTSYTVINSVDQTPNSLLLAWNFGPEAGGGTFTFFNFAIVAPVDAPALTFTPNGSAVASIDVTYSTESSGPGTTFMETFSVYTVPEPGAALSVAGLALLVRRGRRVM